MKFGINLTTERIIKLFSYETIRIRVTGLPLN